MWQDNDTCYLYHHGILGQRWESETVRHILLALLTILHRRRKQCGEQLAVMAFGNVENYYRKAEWVKQQNEQPEEKEGVS